MKKLLLIAALAFSIGQSSVAFAQPESPKARYDADKKLCAEESSSSLRLQCLRDAREEYNRAKAEANQNLKQKSTGKNGCTGCGKVISVSVGEKKGKGSAVGIIGGGIAGAIIGNQIGNGTGRTLATVAGAAGGAYAGDKIEEHVRTTKHWSVRVRLDNGGERTVTVDHDPGLNEGDLVTVAGNTIRRR